MQAKNVIEFSLKTNEQEGYENIVSIGATKDNNFLLSVYDSFHPLVQVELSPSEVSMLKDWIGYVEQYILKKKIQEKYEDE